MLYKQLQPKPIHLGPKATVEFDAGEGTIMVPAPNAKIYVHWLTEKGAIRSTFTMQYATKIWGKCRLINSADSQIDVLTIDSD
jgi:hypothetical protein